MKRTRDELEQLVGQKLTELKPIGGVYFVLRDGELIYIGQSANIHRRATSQHTVLFVEIQDPAQRLALEAKLIWELRPPGNIKGNVHDRVRQLLESMQ